MEIYTIGFTRRSAADFFGTLKSNNIRRLLDIRLNNTSQLAAFAKRTDLPFFLRELCDISYRHETLLAPTMEILTAYRRKQMSWDEYADRFADLMRQRKIDQILDPAEFGAATVLLCSELKPEKCHRRLVVEYLQSEWGDIEAIHL
jgi:uncharacterized protein (DUF488 family)